MAQFVFSFGSGVQSVDGGCGRLASVIANAQGTFVESIVAESGLPVLNRKRRVIPTAIVEGAKPGRIFLSEAKAEIEDYPELKETVLEESATGAGSGKLSSASGANQDFGAASLDPPTIKKKVRQGVQPDKLVLEDGIPVSTDTSKVGALKQLWVDSHTGKIEHVIVHRGLLSRAAAVISAANIEAIREQYILVSLDEEEIDDLPTLRPAR